MTTPNPAVILAAISEAIPHAKHLPLDAPMMNTSDLTGARLDWWVAKAIATRDDVSAIYFGGASVIAGHCRLSANGDIFAPSSLWATGGPIIDHDDIDVDTSRARAPHVACRAVIDGHITGSAGQRRRVVQHGPTKLIAAMRAKVASVFGPEVPEIER